MNDIIGIDHVGVLTRELDKVADRYEALGFTLSPRSRHRLSIRPGEPPVPGNTANQCALFGRSYVELLGIVDETAPDPWGVNKVPDGFRIFYPGSTDAAASERRLSASGVPTLGVRALEREVDTEDGPRLMKGFGLHLDPREAVEGFVGIAQQVTPEYLHQPRYLKHPNGATGVADVVIVTEDSGVEARVASYARVFGVRSRTGDAAHVFDLPEGRLTIVPKSAAAGLLADDPLPAPSYLAAVTIAVRDVGAARELVDGNGVPTRTTGSGFHVSSRDAYGMGIFFTAA